MTLSKTWVKVLDDVEWDGWRGSLERKAELIRQCEAEAGKGAHIEIHSPRSEQLVFDRASSFLSATTMFEWAKGKIAELREAKAEIEATGDIEPHVGKHWLRNADADAYRTNPSELVRDLMRERIIDRIDYEVRRYEKIMENLGKPDEMRGSK